jgi:cell division protein FtsB
MTARTYTAQPTSLPRLRHWAMGMVLPILCLYFLFYLVFGPRGLLAMNRISDELHVTQQTYHELHDERQVLEADVKLMRPNNLDPDMAEEQARKTLGYTRPDEIIIDVQE